MRTCSPDDTDGTSVYVWGHKVKYRLAGVRVAEFCGGALQEIGMGSNRPAVGGPSAVRALPARLVAAAATVTLGATSLLPAAAQAAGDLTDDVLFRSGLGATAARLPMKAA